MAACSWTPIENCSFRLPGQRGSSSADKMAGSCVGSSNPERHLQSRRICRSTWGDAAEPAAERLLFFVARKTACSSACLPAGQEAITTTAGKAKPSSDRVPPKAQQREVLRHGIRQSCRRTKNIAAPISSSTSTRLSAVPRALLPGKAGATNLH